MTNKTKRGIYGYTQKGERVFLGNAELTDEGVQSFLESIAKAYRDGDSGYFHVGLAVFNVQSFAGVSIT